MVSICRVFRPRLVLTSLLTLAAVALTGCGGDDDPEASESPDTSASAGASDSTPTNSPSETPSETPTPTPTAAEVTVTVGPLTDGNERTTDLLESYTAFENAFWSSLAAGEVSTELRAMATPEALVGIEQAVTGQPNPLGGTVTISPVLDDFVLADMGGGPMVTEAVITGCSDQTQLRYDGDRPGASASLLANISFDPSGSYLITNYALGPDAC